MLKGNEWMKEIDDIVKRVTRVAYRNKNKKMSKPATLDYILEEMKKLQEISEYFDKLGYSLHEKVYEYPLNEIHSSTAQPKKKVPTIRNPELTFEPEFDYEDEEWRVLLYKGDKLWVSSYGKVKRYQSGRVLKQGVNRDGRKVVCVGERRSAVLVHKLVAFTFIGERPEGYEIDHVNGNRLDNRAINLEYVTHEENINRAIKLGLIKGQYIPNTGGDGNEPTR